MKSNMYIFIIGYTIYSLINYPIYVVYDLSFFDGLGTFYFLLIKCQCTFSISNIVITFMFCLLLLYLIRF